MEFIKKAFLVNLADYENLGFNLPINILLLCVFVGMCIAFIAVDFNKRYMNLIVRQLLRHEAVGEAKAVSLSSLGLDGSRMVRLYLSGGGHLSRVVGRVGEPTYTYEEYVQLEKEKKLKREKIDFTSAVFYIREDALDRANNISANYRVSMVKTLLLCLLFMMIYLGIMMAMPELLGWVNAVAGA